MQFTMNVSGDQRFAQVVSLLLKKF